MVGNLIYDQFLTARDWPFGAALSLVLVAVMMAPAVRPGRDPARGAHGEPGHEAGCARTAGEAPQGAPRSGLRLSLRADRGLIVLCFNEAGLPTAWSGFSLKWYGALAHRRRSSPRPATP